MYSSLPLVFFKMKVYQILIFLIYEFEPTTNPPTSGLLPLASWTLCSLQGHHLKICVMHYEMSSVQTPI